MILADSRETRGIEIDGQKHIIPEMLKRVMEVQTMQLEVGDYVIIGPTRSCCIETKSAGDYISSITNGKLNTELFQMSCNYDKNVLIVFGSIEEALVHRQIKRQIYANYLAGCVVHESSRGNKGSISVFNFHSIYDAVQLIKSLHDIITADNIYREPAKKHKPTPEMEKEYTIGTFPGIGEKRAKELKKRYKTLKNLVNTSKEDLLEMKGIGKKLADNIWRYANEE